MGISIKKLEKLEDIYDITVEDVHNFYANDILVHNCAEITLPSKPLKSIDDKEGEISLCTLSAINWGLINDPKDFEKYCDLSVRALDALLDYQDYPVDAARISTLNRRPLGVGITNLAYFLAKRGLKYDEDALKIVDTYAQAWSYYLIKASVDLAEELGSCPKSHETKYAKGILPIDTYKKAIDDDIIKHVNRQAWQELRKRLKRHGIRNSTLCAQMPAETSSQISNSTNGIEPPREFVSYKKSKDGVFPQVVPGIHHLKSKYDLLWNQESPKGYLKICAVLQKYIDQGISVNTSYNPKFFDDSKLSMNTLLEDLILSYRWGIKQLYYFNTPKALDDDLMSFEDSKSNDDEECDSCTI